MHRRELLGVLGASAAGLAASPAWAGDDKPKDPLVECGCKCVEACCDAMNWCNEAFLHCSKELAAGRVGHAKAMALLLDCGEVCSAAAKLVARESAFTAQVCRTCAEACAIAAPECEKLDHPTMKDAGKSLKKCADACKALLDLVNKKPAGPR
ncbi:MAG: four-helix bundle copper-binding protein [Gemmataceae bacterium]|nr:four-helix bundle copper-binding protein [Gemmataceae bacterium]